MLNHKFTVLRSPEPTVILGRDFLRRYTTTEFDWANHKVRLGDFWLSSEATITGGQALSRAELVSSAYYLPESNTASSSNECKINPELDPRQKSQIQALLEEFHDVFAENPKKPSTTTTAQHLIETGNALPIKAKSIRVSPQVEAEINVQIGQMLRNGIIRPSSSPWASRVILVRKKDNSYRFAVNYRAVNDSTKKDSYPLPDIKDILDKLSGSRFYSSLDGASAYWSIPIIERDREKTAFITPRGQFEFCVLPFGLCNAQATYQRAIDSALSGATHSLPYIDDTLTYSSTFEDHLTHLRRVLECYRSSQMQLRRDKCRFAHRVINLSPALYRKLRTNPARIIRRSFAHSWV